MLTPKARVIVTVRIPLGFSFNKTPNETSVILFLCDNCEMSVHLLCALLGRGPKLGFFFVFFFFVLVCATKVGQCQNSVL